MIKLEIRVAIPLFVSVLAGMMHAQSLPVEVKQTPVFDTDKGNKFNRPIWMGEIPGLKGNFLVAEQGVNTDSARVWLLENNQGTYAKKPFLAILVRRGIEEQGLLGFAFHPSFTTNRKYYIYYTRPKLGAADTNIIEERTADVTFKKDSAADPRRILAIPKLAINHNGGTMAFGKDKFLYVGVGDDAYNENGQARKKLLGGILRLDVDNPTSGLGYGIPSDNPFVDDPTPDLRKEFWAYGLRNPWKWSFDPLNEDLWVGDVGNTSREEVGIVRKGENMGWAEYEGTECKLASCDPAGKTMPLKEFRRDSAQCITGGVVYRGNEESPLYGAYIFSDMATMHVWALFQKDRQVTALHRIGASKSNYSSFTTDFDGRIYGIGLGSGTIFLFDDPAFQARTTRMENRRRKRLDQGRLLFKSADGYSLNRAYQSSLQGLSGFRADGSQVADFGRFVFGANLSIRIPSGLYILKATFVDGERAFPFVVD
jgi:hypothetical protein